MPPLGTWIRAGVALNLTFEKGEDHYAVTNLLINNNYAKARMKILSAEAKLMQTINMLC